MYAVRFIYPPPPATQRRAERARSSGARRSTRAQPARPRNLDYWFCGIPAIKPVAASDDGVHTRLTFAAQRELPALFVRNDDGTESLLNFSIDQGDVVIHRVARAVHPAARPAHRLHREQGIFRQRRSPAVRHRCAGCAARAQGAAPMNRIQRS